MKFPEVNKTRILEKLSHLPVLGSITRTSRALPCASCSRSVQPIGRKLWENVIVCNECQYTALSNITGLFHTPYGSAIDQHTIRIFAKTLQQDMIAVEIQPVQAVASQLVQGYAELIRWQKAIHYHESILNAHQYSLGAVGIVPPRKISEVMVFRSTKPPEIIDPTERMEPETRETLKKIYEEGPTAISTPF